MTVNRIRPIGRLVPVTAALALLFAACGSDDPTADPVDSVDTTAGEDGLRAPTPIEATSSGNSAGEDSSRMSAEGAAEATADMMIAPAYIVSEFLVGPDMPALPENTTGYVYDAATAPTAEQIAEIADVFGVEGEPVEVDDGYSVSWRVGPDDGSAASVVIWDDAMLSWNYNMAYQDQPVMGCASSGSAGVEPAIAPDESGEIEAEIPEKGEDAVTRDDATESVAPETIVECETPEPPAGVPTEAEAEALATDYLNQLGVDPTTLELDTYADEWSASVNANLMLEGVLAQSWGFTFAGDADLQYAWGNAATAEAVGPYTLVDLETAVARLNDGSYGWTGTARGDIALMSEATAESSEGGGEASVSAEPAVDPAVDVPEGDVAVSEPAPDPMPIEPMPVEPMPEPEEITVTLVDVQPDLWWIWDVSGSAWLVPAYRFIGDDDSVYTVPAVTDDFLVQTEPPVTTEPAPDTVPPTTDGGTDPGSAGPLAEYLGLPLADFEAAVATAGLGPVRIVEIDGELQAVTMDLREGRVNVAVETRDGVQHVISATIESIDGEVPVTTVPEPTTTEAPPTSAAPEVVPITGTFEGVAFYPACGNEILEHEGVTWYPVSHAGFDPSNEELAQLLADLSAVAREESPVSGVDGFARVAPPGPGDDSGTLVVWADGVARWVSDSGTLDVWMVDDEVTYNWVC